MRILFTITLIITSILSSCTKQKEISDLQSQFVNILDINGIPQKPYDLSAFGFSDKGAWHAYSIPPKDSTQYNGSFIGPLVMKMYGQWPSKALSQLKIKNVETNNFIDLSKAKAEFKYLPGKLQQNLIIQDLSIQMDLIFVSNRTSLIRTKIKNNGEKDISLIIGEKGSLFNPKTKLNLVGNRLTVSFNKGNEFITIQNNYSSGAIINKDSSSYYIHDTKAITLKPTEEKTTCTTHTYCFSKEEYSSEEQTIKNALLNFSDVFDSNNKRWNKYLSAGLNTDNKLITDPIYQRVKVKTIETLISNWRSPAGDLKHNGNFPSAAYHGFYGFWSWDSWKHAVALVNFNPELAKNNILSMFDYQDEMGMVADCVYFNRSENNWRDTKAPLSAWAVWKIYEKTKDIDFIKTMYPRLVKYHNWWYKYRDHNKNGLCEYGSTDGTLIAAKWESGMDNAVRFDEAKVLKNNDKAWSLNQESVDLNAYLYAEKIFLMQLAQQLKISDDTEKYQNEAKALKEKVSTLFWDETSGFFYDRNIETGKLILKQQGTEGWIPLWAKIASKEQAQKVMTVMTDKSKFATYMPLPTLSASNNKFNPLKGYWRGPVWLDQAYYGIIALENYSFNDEANIFRKQLLDNAKGLKGNSPIHENYHPLTGEGLNAEHFSWSAAHLYLILN